MLFPVSLFVLAGALSAAASPSINMHLPARELLSQPLVPRQSNTSGISGTSADIPAECKDECTVIDEFYACQNSTDTTCACSNDKASRYADCLSCALTQVDNSTDNQYYLGQNGYDLYQSACKVLGVTIDDHTISANKDGAVRIGVSVGAVAAVALALGAML
ncbi:hypothetical protein BDZ89DRAFT_1071563 [Hymenopellis radicata]|nr:hypothetical protein BDZ89DRAFT_1071563 [Hymenopellis radicata]